MRDLRDAAIDMTRDTAKDTAGMLQEILKDTDT